MTRESKGGLIAWGVGFLFMIALSLPCSPGIRHYPVEIPESLPKTSLADQGILAKAWAEGQTIEIEEVTVFLALNPKTSYLLPKIEVDSPKLYYLGEVSGGPIIHAVWKDSWWRAYRVVNLTLDVERGVLNVLVAPDWGKFLLGGVLLGAVAGFGPAIVAFSLLEK